MTIYLLAHGLAHPLPVNQIGMAHASIKLAMQALGYSGPATKDCTRALNAVRMLRKQGQWGGKVDKGLLDTILIGVARSTSGHWDLESTSHLLAHALIGETTVPGHLLAEFSRRHGSSPDDPITIYTKKLIKAAEIGDYTRVLYLAGMDMQPRLDLLMASLENDPPLRQWLLRYTFRGLGWTW